MGEVEKQGGTQDMEILLQKNILVIVENQVKFGLCLIVAPRLLLSIKEYEDKIIHFLG